MQNQLNEVELSFSFNFDCDNKVQSNLNEDQLIVIPESYLQDLDIGNTFIPLTDLLGSHLGDNLNVTLFNKPVCELQTKLDDSLFVPIKTEKPEEIESFNVETDENDTDALVQSSKLEINPDDDLINIQNVVTNQKLRKKRFRCNLCKYHVQKSDALKIHMKIFHNNNKVFKCNHCDFYTTERSDFTTHLVTHFKEEPYNCDKCSYSTKRSFLMKLHAMTHNGEIPFRCSKCDYNTIYKRKLLEHMWLHADERPFKCAECNYVGLNTKSLSYHIAKKHKFK